MSVCGVWLEGFKMRLVILQAWERRFNPFSAGVTPGMRFVFGLDDLMFLHLF